MAEATSGEQSGLLQQTGFDHMVVKTRCEMRRHEKQRQSDQKEMLVGRYLTTSHHMHKTQTAHAQIGEPGKIDTV